MNWSKSIRQMHRWLGVTLVALTVVAFAAGSFAPWVYYLPLPPLFLLMLSGLYMFFLPYFRKAKSE